MELLELHWYDHALFFLTAIVIPLLSVMARPVQETMSEEMDEFLPLPPKKHLYYQNGLVLLIGSLLVLTAWNAADRNWAGLGFAPMQWNSIVIVAAGLLCTFYLLDLVRSYLNTKETQEKIKELQQILPLNWSEYKHYIFLALAAGICEEIVFRGFLINYLNTLLKGLDHSVIYAIVLPAVTFGMSHWYQGKAAVAKIIFISVLFGVVFVWSGSLILIMIIHTSIDLISGLSGIFIHKANPKDELQE